MATPDGALWLGTNAGFYRLLPEGTLQQLPLPVPAPYRRYPPWP